MDVTGRFMVSKRFGVTAIANMAEDYVDMDLSRRIEHTESFFTTRASVCQYDVFEAAQQEKDSHTPTRWRKPGNG